MAVGRKPELHFAERGAYSELPQKNLRISHAARPPGSQTGRHQGQKGGSAEERSAEEQPSERPRGRRSAWRDK